jgi:hypothetical protein
VLLWEETGTLEGNGKHNRTTAYCKESKSNAKKIAGTTFPPPTLSLPFGVPSSTYISLKILSI